MNMKILDVKRIREADLYTIQHEPIADIDLMERASRQMFQWFIKKFSRKQKFVVVAGMGNNGGDGYAVARLLLERGYDVDVYQLAYSSRFSASAEINFNRFSQLKPVHIIRNEEDFSASEEGILIVDAIFGSGLSRPAKGLAAAVIRKINESQNRIVSIDVPSGMFIDKSNKAENGEIVKADFCLTLQFPKKAFLFADNQEYVKAFKIIDIGLHKDYINGVQVDDFYLQKKDVKNRLKKRGKFSHKGTYGHGLLIAGSYGMFGAAILASKAAIRAGAGLITSHIPGLGMNAMQIANPEIMLRLDENEKNISDLPMEARFNAIAVGPGIGTQPVTIQAFIRFLELNTLPLILDADALNILAAHKQELKNIPHGSILTPHPKEFERLFGKSENDFERYELLKMKARELQAYIVLKGAHTAIACPDGKVFFNSTGNPGMATAGSGDVLTGIMLGLMTSGYKAEDTALIAVYLHGKAGDIAARKKGYESLLSGDIITYLPDAFLSIYD
jgi:NAD(P)H-hydrate epimerase